MQAAKGEEDARPWGTDVLQAYMDKQLGKECVLASPLLMRLYCAATRQHPLMAQSLQGECTLQNLSEQYCEGMQILSLRVVPSIISQLVYRLKDETHLHQELWQSAL